MPASLSSLFQGRAFVVLLATLVGMGVTARLGVWQLDRAAQKESLQLAIDERAQLPAVPAAELASSPEAAAAQHHRRVLLRGEWIHAATVFLENRQMNGRPGFFVMTPLRLHGARAVVVQRGWVPRDAADRSRLPGLPAASGEVTVAGRIAPPPARLYEFDPAASGPIRQNLDLAAHARETGLELLPVTVVQDAPEAGSDGLSRDWPRVTVDVHKHHGYAFQWFALCALMAGLYVWFQLLRPRFTRQP